MKLNSYTITQGRDRAPARAMLKAIGFTDEDLKKPIIGFVFGEKGLIADLSLEGTKINLLDR